MNWLGEIFFVGGILGVIFRYKHLLRILLGFEMIMVGLIGILCFNVGVVLRNVIFFLIFIVVMVGEGVLGLRLIVCIVVWYGEESYSRIGCLKW